MSLLGGGQLRVVEGCGRSLAEMPGDGIVDSLLESLDLNPAIVKELSSNAQTPEWRGLHLVVESISLDDSVAQSRHIVEQEVAVRSESDPRKSRFRSGSADVLGIVAAGTADRVEDCLAAHSAPWRLGRRGQVALEVGDPFDEQDTIDEWLFWIGDQIALRQQVCVTVGCIFNSDDGIGDSHLVEGGISTERKQSSDLCLPAEASYRQWSQRILQ